MAIGIGLVVPLSHKTRDQRVMSLYGWEPLNVTHHPPKLGGHKHCDSEDINILANTVSLPQMCVVSNYINLLSSAVIIFCEAHGMSCATHLSNSNFRNNF